MYALCTGSTSFAGFNKMSILSDHRRGHREFSTMKQTKESGRSPPLLWLMVSGWPQPPKIIISSTCPTPLFHHHGLGLKIYASLTGSDTPRNVRRIPSSNQFSRFHCCTREEGRDWPFSAISALPSPIFSTAFPSPLTHALAGGAELEIGGCHCISFIKIYVWAVHF